MEGGIPQASVDDRIACEKCHGVYAVKTSPDGTEPHIRCSACGHVREVPIAPVREMSEDGQDAKWTVIGPDGKVMTYPSWSKLIRSEHPSALTEIAEVNDGGARPAEEKRPSATALLDITPMAPKLTLPAQASGQGLAASTTAPSPRDPTARRKGPEWAPAKRPPPEEAPESAHGPVSEPTPLSLRDAIIEDDPNAPAPLSLRDAIIERVDSCEALSVKDLQVISSAEDHAADATPLPPPRGVLKTLPPTAKDDGATAPPPTISVEDSPSHESSKSSISTKSTTTSRGWPLPALAVAGMALVVWRMMAAPPTQTPHVQATGPSAAAPSETESAPDGIVAETRAPAESAPSSGASATVSAEPTATAAREEAAAARDGTRPSNEPAARPSIDAPSAADKTAAAPAEGATSVSDLLDRAGSAKRKGDLATARGLYERVLRMNPRNVEANGGLGDVARAQGDLRAAKASYERALAASPAYGPAQLGLADTEWELGDRAGAQRRYAQIVARLGDRAPARAKQRGVVTE